ncbi:MAG: hypothetical protein AAF621_00905 [Pseudomonadota bacterium]
MQKHIKYFFSSPETRTQMLLYYATHDQMMSTLVKKLENFGYRINFSWRLAHGQYDPIVLSLKNTKGVVGNLKDFFANNAPKANITLSRRAGLASNLHHFLHELVHFAQDIEGQLNFPMIVKDQPVSLLREQDFIDLYLFNEAHAATEAIRASHRLMIRHNIPEAWWGCYLSRDWHDLSSRYHNDLGNRLNEMHAARRCFEGWYKLPLRKIYQKKAQMVFSYFKSLSSDYVHADFCMNSFLKDRDYLPSYIYHSDPVYC